VIEKRAQSQAHGNELTKERDYPYIVLDLFANQKVMVMWLEATESLAQVIPTVIRVPSTHRLLRQYQPP
jgi:hypothetical protein